MSEKKERQFVKEIYLNRAEGQWAGDRKTKLYSFDQADDMLLEWASTAPFGGGYDKVDFVVVYPDGGEYKGTYGLKNAALEKPCLADHMLSELRFSSGINRPSHMSEEKYQMILDKCPDTKREALEFLEQYQVGPKDKSVTSLELAQGILEEVYHQLATDSDLETLAAADKYAYLIDRMRVVLHDLNSPQITLAAAETSKDRLAVMQSKRPKM